MLSKQWKLWTLHHTKYSLNKSLKPVKKCYQTEVKQLPGKHFELQDLQVQAVNF